MSAGISGAAIGGLAASIGGSLISSAMSPGTSGGGGQSYYVPSGLQSADQTWQNLLTQQAGNQNLINSVIPYYGQSLSAGLNGYNLYEPGYQNAANDAANGYRDLAASMTAQGNSNLATQSNLLGAGWNAYNLGLDPQKALYGRTVQQLQDQTGATNSMYGLGSSAAGAGVANQALSNFNIDWQNQQLSRALQGLQGLSGAAGTAGSYGQLGTAQLSAAPGYMLQSGELPYTVNQAVSAVPGQLASTYANQIESGPLASASGIMGQIIPYMNYGQGAQSVPFQTQAQGAGALGSLVSQGINSAFNSGGSNWLSSLFGSGTTGSFSNGDFSGAFSSNPYYSGGGNSWGFTT